MEIGKTLIVTNRQEWRAWLAKNYDRKQKIWLIFYRKASGRERIPYNDAVEEALCFGWIDSIEKGIDSERFAQRFSPRRPKSNWSEMNKERVRRLIAEGRMTPAGLSKFPTDDEFKIPSDILEILKKDKKIWENFQKFPEPYQRIRIGFIDAARTRPEEFQKRLRYFLKLTRQNKKFGIDLKYGS